MYALSKWGSNTGYCYSRTCVILSRNGLDFLGQEANTTKAASWKGTNFNSSFELVYLSPSFPLPLSLRHAIGIPMSFISRWWTGDSRWQQSRWIHSTWCLSWTPCRVDVMLSLMRTKMRRRRRQLKRRWSYRPRISSTFNWNWALRKRSIWTLVNNY